jgi:methylthioribulose-1-phosphate dehydratase
MDLDKTIVEQARADLVTVARRLAARGFCEAKSGTLSLKVKDAPTRLLITALDVDKHTLSPEDVVLVDGGGEPVNGETRLPSRDVRLHVKIHAVVEATAVIHAHPPHAVALSRVLKKKGQVSFRGLELARAFDGVDDLEDNGLKMPIEPSEKDVDRMATRALAHRKELVPAVAFEGRGVAVWGRDLAEALRYLEAVEALCQVLALERAMGG